MKKTKSDKLEPVDIKMCHIGLLGWIYVNGKMM